MPWGYSQKSWVGVCGPLPKTLTLLMTKISHFWLPFYDLTMQTFDALFTTVAAGKVTFNISHEGRLLMVLLLIMKK